MRMPARMSRRKQVADFIRDLMDTAHCQPASLVVSLGSAVHPSNTTAGIVRAALQSIPGLSIGLDFGFSCDVVRAPNAPNNPSIARAPFSSGGWG